MNDVVEMTIHLLVYRSCRLPSTFARLINQIFNAKKRWETLVNNGFGYIFLFEYSQLTINCSFANEMNYFKCHLPVESYIDPSDLAQRKTAWGRQRTLFMVVLMDFPMICWYNPLGTLTEAQLR